MKKFVIERILPGAGNLSAQELQEVSLGSFAVARQMSQVCHWIQSFVTEDKIYCIYIAESEEVLREHARLGNIPINTVAEVKAVIDPMTGIPIG
jgi:penicillin-binding protein-related factor A (putative recombinase)